MLRKQMYAILQQYWGYKSFLPLQEEAILSVLENEDSLTVLPTGGGKSLCFQLPALLKKGMAVIVSPLISLMKDQVDNLKDMGVASCCLNSSQPFEQQALAIEQIRKGKIKLLYVSPERLQSQVTINLLNSVRLSFYDRTISRTGFFIQGRRIFNAFGNRYRKTVIARRAITGTG